LIGLENPTQLLLVKINILKLLGAYGQSKILFVRDEKNDHPKFLEEVYMSCAKKNGKK